MYQRMTKKEVTKIRTKELRKKIGVTQAQLAHYLGVSTATIKSWEGGVSKPTEKNRQKIEHLEQHEGKCVIRRGVLIILGT